MIYENKFFFSALSSFRVKVDCTLFWPMSQP